MPAGYFIRLFSPRCKCRVHVPNLLCDRRLFHSNIFWFWDNTETRAPKEARLHSRHLDRAWRLRYPASHGGASPFAPHSKRQTERKLAGMEESYPSKPAVWEGWNATVVRDVLPFGRNGRTMKGPHNP